MAAVGIAFKFTNDRPVGHTEVNYHLVFNVKRDFTHKARYVAGGHLTDLPENLPTHTSVIYYKSVRTLFLIYDLYNIKLIATDIRNNFLNDQCAENFFKVGPKFKSCEVMWEIIVCALYVPKRSVALFRAHLANNLWTMGFKPSFSDCDVWMRKNFIPLNQ